VTSKYNEIACLYLFEYLIKTMRTLEFQSRVSFSKTLSNRYIYSFILTLLCEGFKNVIFLLSYIVIKIYDAMRTKLSI
jgi:hypothetical protein